MHSCSCQAQKVSGCGWRGACPCNSCHGNILLEIRRLFIKSCKESLSLQEQQVCDRRRYNYYRYDLCITFYTFSVSPSSSSLSPPPSPLPLSPGTTQPSRSRSQTSPRRRRTESSQGTHIVMHIAAGRYSVYLPPLLPSLPSSYLN